MGCGCKGTVENPRQVTEVVQTPLTAAEVQARMPGKPIRRVQADINGTPRRA